MRARHGGRHFPLPRAQPLAASRTGDIHRRFSPPLNDCVHRRSFFHFSSQASQCSKPGVGKEGGEASARAKQESAKEREEEAAFYLRAAFPLLRVPSRVTHFPSLLPLSSPWQWKTRFAKHIFHFHQPETFRGTLRHMIRRISYLSIFQYNKAKR